MKNNLFGQVAGFFAQRNKFTILLILSILTVGAVTYTSILKREGFPTINIPIIVVTTPYFSQDPAKTEKDITAPIYDVISEKEGIKSVTSTSTGFISSFFISLDEDTDASRLKKDLEADIDKLKLKSPSSIIVPEAGKIDGKSDLIFSIYSETLGIKDLENRANEIALQLEKSPLIKDVIVNKASETKFNFQTQKEEVIQTSFNRVGESNNGKLNFYDSVNIGIVRKNEKIGALEISNETKEIVSKYLKNEDIDNIKVSYLGDPANSLQQQIKSLENNALAAIITIFIILLLFINWRSAVILALFIPLTLAGVFIVFAIAGYSLNTISLFALVLVLGLFVDDGTIVVEAIDYYKRNGYKGFEAVKMALSDIGVADVSGTMTTVLVFTPLLTVSGVLGDFIKILPLTVIIALLVSLLIALTILPYISSVLIKDATKVSKKNIGEVILGFVSDKIIILANKSSEIVRGILDRRVLKVSVLLLTLALLLVGGYFASKLQFSFFAPAKDSDQISLTMSFKQNDIKMAYESSKAVEIQILSKYSDEIKSMTYLEGNERSASLWIELTPLTDRELKAPEIVSKINEDSLKIDNAVVTASVISAGPPQAQYPFTMQIYGDELESFKQISTELKDFIFKQKLSNSVEIEDVTVAYINDVRKKDAQRYAEIQVKFDGTDNSSTYIELQNLITDNYQEKNMDKLANLNLELGFDLGQETQNAESFSSVALAAGISILAMYILLVLQFNSFIQPLLVLIAVPFSFPGLFTGLYLTDNPMSFFVVIGLTGLIGIVVNNTIMLIEYANSRRDSGMEIKEAILEAVKLRMRPIFTTSLTTIAGLVPLAITEPFWEPLAFTIIFGLISSVFMIMLSFPVIYYYTERVLNLKRVG